MTAPKERRRLLEIWIKSKENLDACEAGIQIIKTQGASQFRERHLTFASSDFICLVPFLESDNIFEESFFIS